MICITLLR